jgi:hypothetical protein
VNLFVLGLDQGHVIRFSRFQPFLGRLSQVSQLIGKVYFLGPG